MKIIFPHSTTFAKEEALSKRAQQAQPSQYDKWQIASQLISALSKIDPANAENFAELKNKADKKLLTDQELAQVKQEILKELPVLKQSVEMLEHLVYRLP